MSKARRKVKLTLSEQLVELSTPKPVSFHPDEDDLADITAAKVCDFPIEDVESSTLATDIRRFDEFDDDPRYSGRAVTRRQLVGNEEEYFDDDSVDANSWESGESGGEFPLDDDEQLEVCDDISNSQSGSDDDNDAVNGTVSDSDSAVEVEEEVKPGIFNISLESLKEDIKKGKAAKHQLSVWDGLLETRIKLHKVLGSSNQLPHRDALGHFTKMGETQTKGLVRECCLELNKLMNDLLELQHVLLLRNSDTYSIVSGGASCHEDTGVGDEVENEEEVPSDIIETDEDESNIGEQVTETNQSCLARRKKRRKRKRRDWVDQNGTRDYESYVSRLHNSFKTYQDQTITKWNTKTRIAGGKLTNKSFLQVDHSVLSQIKHILADKPRLLKRTQLKRSVYRTLGRDSETKHEGDSEEMDQSEDRRDLHLKDYNEEVFDDDDFYHQLLRELIDRKMDLTETLDPIAMGRQWLQLQKLRTKAKKKMDTKASKGRKIRYNIHPKLTNFMVAMEKGTMADVSRNDLFVSLFG